MIACCAPTPRWRRRSLATESRVLAEETIAVPATAGELGALHAALERFWYQLDRLLDPAPGQSWRVKFTTAVAEIGANIVEHAYPAGTSRRSLALRLRLYPDRVEARFVDCGVAYRPPSEPPQLPTVDPLDLPDTGFGFAIVQRAVDRLRYRRTSSGKNLWRLVKRLSR